MIHFDPWYADTVNYLVTGQLPEGWNKHDRDRFLHLVKFYIWDDPYLFKHCFDQIVRRYAPDHDMRRILSFCHARPVEGTLMEKRLWPKYFKMDFIGHLT